MILSDDPDPETLSALVKKATEPPFPDIFPIKKTIIIEDTPDGRKLSFKNGSPNDIDKIDNLGVHFNLKKIDIETIKPGTRVAEVTLGYKTVYLSRQPGFYGNLPKVYYYSIKSVDTVQFSEDIERSLVGKVYQFCKLKWEKFREDS